MPNESAMKAKNAVYNFVLKKSAWVISIVATVTIVASEILVFLVSREFLEVLFYFISPGTLSAYVFVTSYNLRPVVFFLSVILMTCAAAFVYRLRCRRRLRYGLIEVFVGVAAVLWSARSILSDLLVSSAETGTQVFFQIVAGLYVIVRGLDNVEKGLNVELNKAPKTRLERLWRKVFHSPEVRPLPHEPSFDTISS